MYTSITCIYSCTCTCAGDEEIGSGSGESEAEEQEEKEAIALQQRMAAALKKSDFEGPNMAVRRGRWGGRRGEVTWGEWGGGGGGEEGGSDLG